MTGCFLYPLNSLTALQDGTRGKESCPSKLREGLFTTAAVDNIDHNPSSISAHDSFHGTAISLVQHPTTEERGNDKDTDVFDPTKSSTSKKIAQLPSSYSGVPPVALPSGQLISQHQASSNSESDREIDWLDNAKELLSKEELNKSDFISWAAYCASKSSLPSHEPAIISLLPRFFENAHSLAMIAHSMKVIKSAVQHINPSQISSNCCRPTTVRLGQANSVETG